MDTPKLNPNLVKFIVRPSLYIIFLFIYLSSFGQTKEYQNLLDLVSIRQGIVFAHSKPLSSIRLEQKEMKYYSEDYSEYSDKTLDTGMFRQIINNCKTIDTSLWLQNEMTHVLFVNHRDEFVSKKYAIKKLALTDKKQIKHIKKQVNKFNSTDNYTRDIYYFSRPVFDDSKQFAVIQWSNGHSGLLGGGAIVLYQLVDNSWKELGIVNRWRY